MSACHPHRRDLFHIPHHGFQIHDFPVDHAAAMRAGTYLIFKDRPPVRVLELPESFRNVELVDIWDDRFLGLCIPAVP
jgi:hypothetical protein